MYKWEDLKNANETIKTTDIKGKDYAEVNQRIKAFRMVCPQGAIITEMLSNENGVCVFKATILNDEQVVLGTGTAYENEKSSFINKTSYIENCETSAVGRALGMCGFGIDTSVASFEEVTNAINNQGEKKEGEKKKSDITKEMVVELLLLADQTGTDRMKMLKAYKTDNAYDLSKKQYEELTQNLEKRKANQEQAKLAEAIDAMIDEDAYKE